MTYCYYSHYYYYYYYYWLVNSLDNVSDGDVDHTVVEHVNLDGAANESSTQWDGRRVNEIDAITAEPRVWLVLHYEHDVR